MDFSVSKVKTITELKTRSGGHKSFIQFDFTMDGTATSGDNDYVPASGEVRLASGQVSQVVTIQVLGDAKREANEEFSLVLTQGYNAAIADRTGRAVITNDDADGDLGGGSSGGSSGGGGGGGSLGGMLPALFLAAGLLRRFRRPRPAGGAG